SCSEGTSRPPLLTGGSILEKEKLDLYLRAAEQRERSPREGGGLVLFIYSKAIVLFIDAKARVSNSLN
uniref:Uncharacterized protein n=1 Tax=Oryza brachyantha TaxID=4533 RepID=J3MWF1_ORYBR